MEGECAETKLWEVSYQENVGRILVATEDIETEEIVLEDKSIISAPDGFPTCLGCLGPVDGQHACPGCSWPSCGAEECIETSAHQAECRIFKDSNLAPVLRNFSQPHSMYAMVAVVRMMLLKKQNPEEYRVIEDLMDHWEERSKDNVVCDMVKYIGAFCRKKLNLEWVTDVDVQHAFGVLKTNGVGHANKNGSKMCFLYPTVSLMSHSCAANLEIVDSPARSVKFVAKRKIKKGEELSWSYTNFLLPKDSIQGSLNSIWLFQCQCSRCSNPSELGLYYSSQKCSCGGYFSLRLDDDDQCDKCEEKVDSKTRSMLEMSMIKEMSLADESELCCILKKMENCHNIHSTHHVMVRLYIRLVESVARIKPKPSILPTAVECGKTLVSVLTVLDGENGKLMKKYRKLCSFVEYKEAVQRCEDGELSQKDFQEKLEELKVHLF